PPRAPGRSRAERVRVRPLDDAPITRAHLAMLVVMVVAVTIDLMKPITLAFVAPGMATEYGLKSALNPGGSVPVALLPLSGIGGTVVGSFAWGWLGDRVGRRASILLAGVLFTTTAICGAMPAFSWNLAMCFMMGVGAGGMLPIAFTLIAETLPTRHRGWLMVLIGGQSASAYALTSWLAGTLVPVYSWRILWLLGLPTGLLVIMLNRWIPESPRFLLATGRTGEAQLIMARYGIKRAEFPGQDLPRPAGQQRYLELFRHRFAGPTAALVLLGLGVGLITYGFQLWIPTNLQRLGFDQVTADSVLRDSSLIGLPLSFVTAWLYGAWSSKKTIIILGLLMVAALTVFAAWGNPLISHRLVLNLLLAVPIWGMGSLAALVVAYGSELYPTALRARGTGLAAGATKAGGVLVIAMVVLAVATPSIATTALIGVIPVAVALAALVLSGRETSGRGLDLAVPGPATVQAAEGAD
ncbi:MAG: MFS transporter, partial [Actinobacteria bacterium]|nr:MFS transporter [Actinomycetota bacterium]